jgi:hypothetical protein
MYRSLEKDFIYGFFILKSKAERKSALIRNVRKDFEIWETSFVLPFWFEMNKLRE